MDEKLDVGWRCPKDEAGRNFGFNNGDIAIFQDDPWYSLAREITQNTNDAKLTDPAFLEFKLISVPTEEFPNKGEFIDILQDCKDASEIYESDSNRAKKFFANALKIMQKSTIPMLAIRDRNTTGIEGPSVNGTKFHAFMKSTGASNKEAKSAGTGGSHGLGKSAPYTLSDLRTLFVVTKYKNETSGKIDQLAQARACFRSNGKQGTEFQNMVYWGAKENFEPLSGSSSALPEWMTNSFSEANEEPETGTTLFVAGFRPNLDWEKLIAAYVIENFFAAIHAQELVVEVGDKYKINKDTIATLFHDEEIYSALKEQPKEPSRFDASKSSFQVITDENSVRETSQLRRNLGKTSVKILLGEDLPRQVGLVRSGMLITHALPMLERFPGMKGFAAVVEVENQKGIDNIKALEDPRHENLSTAWLPDDKAEKLAKKQLAELSNFVRTRLNDHAKNSVEDQINLDELSELLGSDAVGADSNKQGEMNPTGRIVLARRPKPTLVRGRKPETREVSSQHSPGIPAGGELSDDKVETKTKKRGAKPSGIGDKEGVGKAPSEANENKNETKRGVSKLDLNNVHGVKIAPNARRLSLLLPYDCTLGLSFEKVGEAKNLTLKIQDASDGVLLDKKTVGIDVRKMVKTTFDVVFTEDFEGAIKVIANAI